ncbi:hypothetical protein MTP99_011293 [Tenebrio molitor]|nr:hypothetical protein MTP99_011293 [Tenebrio molitor]
MLRKWGLEYYPIYKLWVISVSAANIMSPEDMKLILSDIKHMKKSPAYNLLNKWLGTGILTSSGTKWQTRRKILTPAFHFNILQDFIEIFNEKTEELVEVLKRECYNTCTEITPIITHFALKIIGEKDFHSDSTKRTRKRLAMLDLLLTAKREEGFIDNEGIREEVDTFMFGGHDTVSTAITFALMMIANHPQVQEEIVNEMKDVLGDIKKKPQYSDLQELSYMERCLKEVLRLYPSVHYISRELGKDLVTHTGYKLKKGTVVQLHIYDLHHNPEVYPDPEKFDPDR